MIDLWRLQLLRELDRCGTIAATATAVHMTPSAVSQQLATLSREAGTPMLEPDGRRVRLTEAAQLLLGHAHEIFTHLENAESDLAAFRRGDSGTVRLGAFPSAFRPLAVRTLQALAATSRLRVEIREVQPELAVDALLARRVDVALTLSATDVFEPASDTRLRCEPLHQDVLDVVLPIDHPAAAQSEVDLQELADEDWIINMPGVPCWQVTQAACERAGFRPRARHYADEFTGAIALVAAGAGVSLLPRLARDEFLGQPVAVRRVAGPVPPRRNIGVMVRAGTEQQPHIAPVLGALRQAAADLTEDATTSPTLLPVA